MSEQTLDHRLSRPLASECRFSATAAPKRAQAGARTLDTIRLYVIWSADDPVGLPLAEMVARHFDNADEAREFGGIRVPVFVRYQAFSSASSAPRPIDLDAAKHNLVVAIGTHYLSDRVADDPAGAGSRSERPVRQTRRQ